MFLSELPSDPKYKEALCAGRLRAQQKVFLGSWEGSRMENLEVNKHLHYEAAVWWGQVK